MGCIDTTQAQYTDLLILNKHELVSEMQLETCIDRILDLELDVPIPRILSQKGHVDKDMVFGLDARLVNLDALRGSKHKHEHEHAHGESDHAHDHHQSEIEVLSITMTTQGASKTAGIDLQRLEGLLKEAPKDEVYRIKAILYLSSTPTSSNGDKAAAPSEIVSRYILNWAFGRWTFTAASEATAVPAGLPTPTDSGISTPTQSSVGEVVLKMTVMTARGESSKWKRNIVRDGSIALAGEDSTGSLVIERVG